MALSFHHLAEWWGLLDSPSTRDSTSFASVSLACLWGNIYIYIFLYVCVSCSLQCTVVAVVGLLGLQHFLTLNLQHATPFFQLPLVVFWFVLLRFVLCFFYVRALLSDWISELICFPLSVPVGFPAAIFRFPYAVLPILSRHGKWSSHLCLGFVSKD